jgi:hypothetical protein
MAAKKKQQTHAKRARELAVREKRERKAAKKAARSAGLLDAPMDENGNGDSEAETEEPAATDEWIS